MVEISFIYVHPLTLHFGTCSSQLWASLTIGCSAGWWMVDLMVNITTVVYKHDESHESINFVHHWYWFIVTIVTINGRSICYTMRSTIDQFAYKPQWVNHRGSTDSWISRSVRQATTVDSPVPEVLVEWGNCSASDGILSLHNEQCWAKLCSGFDLWLQSFDCNWNCVWWVNGCCL